MCFARKVRVRDRYRVIAGIILPAIVSADQAAGSFIRFEGCRAVGIRDGNVNLATTILTIIQHTDQTTRDCIGVNSTLRIAVGNGYLGDVAITVTVIGSTNQATGTTITVNRAGERRVGNGNFGTRHRNTDQTADCPPGGIGNRSVHCGAVIQFNHAVPVVTDKGTHCGGGGCGRAGNRAGEGAVADGQGRRSRYESDKGGGTGTCCCRADVALDRQVFDGCTVACAADKSFITRFFHIETGDGVVIAIENTLEGGGRSVTDGGPFITTQIDIAC